MYTAKITASSDNIPTTFSSAAGSYIISEAPSGGILYVMNLTTSVVMVTNVPYSEIVPSSTLSSNRSQCPIPPGASTANASGIIIDLFKIKQGDRIYIRSDSGSPITTGTFYLTIL